ncbi:MAG: hypothetical protein JKY37_03570 [Nannocystaceae bacterium]|nr:hypothetical protein [Nannocystaceae bacterium]
MSVAQQGDVTEARPLSRTNTLPWLAAMLVGAAVHGGWLVHEMTSDDAAPSVVVVPAQPTVVVVNGGRSNAQHMTAEACDREQRRDRKHKRKHRKRRHRAAKAAMASMASMPPDAILCEGHRCTIDRALVDAWIEDPAMLARSARMVPDIRDQEIIGFKLYGIRDGSVPKLLGFKNGDLITSVGGKTLGSVGAVMEVYGSLRTTDEVEVTLIRKGAPMTKSFRLQ